jgi:hypothetical protein
MTQTEAREIFQDKLALCDVLGLDIRQACIEAGVPGPMLERIIRDHAAKTAATNRCIADPAVLPVCSPVSPEGNEPGFLCLGQKLTGLPMIVWVLQRRPNGWTARGAPGSPYLRVQADHDAAPRTDGSARVSLKDPPEQVDGPPIPTRDFGALCAFICANRGALAAYWNRADTRIQLLKRIVPVS